MHERLYGSYTKIGNLEFKKDKYEDIPVFIDPNPSFSIYTQMGILSSDYIIIPQCLILPHLKE